MAKYTGCNPKSKKLTGRNDLLPDLTIEQVNIKELAPAKHPVRKPTNRQISKVAASIGENGFVTPVLVGADNELIDGHTRVAAARKLGLKRVSGIRVEHLGGDAIRALRVALNKTQETGEWDEQALKLELTYQLEIGTDLRVLGFEAPEIDAILEISAAPDDEADPLDQIDDVICAEAPMVTRPGDIWKLHDHLIVCGDFKDDEIVQAAISDGSPDLVMSDPPFNVRVNGHVRSKTVQFEEFAEASGEMSNEQFANFLTRFLALAKETTQKGALIYSFMDWRHMREMLTAADIVGLELINLCVWVKPNGGMGSFYRSRHELVFVFRHPGDSHMNNIELGVHGRYRTNVWEYAGATGGRTDYADDFSLHPTVKPVRLIEDAILDASVVGATVLDPFLGSGTTLLAAERTQRRCVGIEISPVYLDVAIRRWEALTGDAAVHANSGRTFAECTEAIGDLQAKDAPAEEDV